MNKEKKLKLKHIGYRMDGEAEVRLWDNTIGTMNMTIHDFDSVTKPTRKEIQEHLNDGGYGCERITYAYVRLYELYERGVVEFIEDYDFDESECVDAKRGA